MTVKIAAEAVLVDIDKLIPYENNAKEHPDEQIDALAEMFKRYGFDQPIVVDKNMVIAKGHGRRLAAMKAGMTKVPVTVRSDLTAAEIRASRIADNKIAETDWNEQALIGDLKKLEAEDAELLNHVGISDDELKELLADPPEQGKTDPDDVPENVETRCKPGDLWVLGGYYECDCGERHDL